MLKRSLVRAACPACRALVPQPQAAPLASLAAIQQARAFTTSPRQNVNVLFQPTDTPELDETLSTILHKIILPARLPEKQWELIHDPARSDYLQRNPVVVEVEGYEYRFPTLDVSKGDVPPTRKMFWQALSQMSTQKGWANFPSLLYGMKESGRRFSPSAEAKMVRLAAQAGHPYPIIDCAKQYRQTGLRLDSPEKVLLLLAGIVNRAISSGWKDEAAWNVARRWSLMVEELVQQKEHLASLRPMHRDPITQALVTFPLANLVANIQEGKDVDNLLRRQLEKLLVAWPSGRGLSDMYSDDYCQDRDRGFAILRDPTQVLGLGTLVIRSFYLARQALAADPQPGNKALSRKLLAREKTVFNEMRTLWEDDKLEAERGKEVFGRLIRKSRIWHEHVSGQTPAPVGKQESGEKKAPAAAAAAAPATPSPAPTPAPAAEKA